MLRRRGVVASWEPKRSGDTVDLVALLEKRIKALQDDPSALIYGDALALTVDVLDKQEIRARFMTLRAKGESPVQYDPGSGLTPIVIPDGSYIADVMHLLFRMDGFICFDRHDNGPTLGELAQYFKDFLHAPINIVSLYNRSIEKDIDDMRDRLRKIEIGLIPANVVDEDGRGLVGSFLPLAWGERVHTVGLTLGVGHARSDVYLDQELQDAAMALVGDAGELVERMILHGRRRSTGRVENPINVLRGRVGDHIHLKPSKESDEMPDPEDAYRKLAAMFDKFASDGVLAKALMARVLKIKK